MTFYQQINRIPSNNADALSEAKAMQTLRLRLRAEMEEAQSHLLAAVTTFREIRDSYSEVEEAILFVQQAHTPVKVRAARKTPASTSAKEAKLLALLLSGDTEGAMALLRAR